MSTYKNTKKNTNVSTETVDLNATETMEPEIIDDVIVSSYQELNNKCDKIITKIKSRKIKK